MLHLNAATPPKWVEFTRTFPFLMLWGFPQSRPIIISRNSLVNLFAFLYRGYSQLCLCLSFGLSSVLCRLCPLKAFPGFIVHIGVPRARCEHELLRNQCSSCLGYYQQKYPVCLFSFGVLSSPHATDKSERLKRHQNPAKNQNTQRIRLGDQS